MSRILIPPLFRRSQQYKVRGPDSLDTHDSIYRRQEYIFLTQVCWKKWPMS